VKYKAILSVLVALLPSLAPNPARAQSNIFNVLYGFSPRQDFDNSDGVNPVGPLNFSSNRLFGTTSFGGVAGAGTLFSVNIDSSGFTNLHIFSGGGDGNQPTASIFSDGKLYGTTEFGGARSNGTIFSLNTDGSGFINLYSFTATTNSFFATNSDGASPLGGLAISGGVLYGTAQDGGAWGYGTIFRINTDGSEFTNLYTFSALNDETQTNSDGAEPWAGLVICGGTLRSNI
jgi:uncharacterized repeat protein (TIGR03803 family)